ncbi:hypothetical protein D3C87_1586850 [compost metagenome]
MGIERGNHAFEGLLDEHAFGMQLRTQRIGDIDIKTGDLTVGREHVERRIATVNAKTDGVEGLSRRRTAQRQAGQ